VDAPVDESISARSYDFLFGATQRPPAPEEVEAAAQADDETSRDLNGADDRAAASTVDVDTPDMRSERASSDTAGWNTMIGLRLDDRLATASGAQSVGDGSQERGAGVQASPLIDALPWVAPGEATPESEPPRWTPPVDVPPPVVASRAHEIRTEVTVSHTRDGAARLTDGEATDTDGRTTNRAAILAAMADAAALAGPTVLAGRCPNGHLSPAHAAKCRVCATAMPAQDAVEIPRPALGVLRLSTGDVVTLDRGILLGRSPDAPTDASERPHLVRIVSPENDVSRNHAEILLDGWHVYARDLGSTNGTTVTLPGQAPIRLRHNDLQLLENGAVVTLAEEVSCTFEVTA
jgi:hypothetical protein